MARKKKITPAVKIAPEIADSQGIPTDIQELPALLVPAPPMEQPEPTPAKPRYTWIIDPGHGPRTHGKHSPVFKETTGTVPAGQRFKEWMFNQETAEHLVKMCHALGIDARITLPASRRGDDLDARVNVANEMSSALPKIFISIHANAGPTRSDDHWSLAHGTETFYWHTSKRGKGLAGIFQKKMLLEFGFLDRGIKPTTSFRVLRKTHMPAILPEVGFYNNRQEVQVLAAEDGAKRYARALLAGIIEVEGV